MGHPSEDRSSRMLNGAHRNNVDAADRMGTDSLATTGSQLDAPPGKERDGSLEISPSRDEERSRSALKKPSERQRICGKCQRALTGQFVRALGDIYHLECFTCHDCGKIVASKFFPVPDQPPGQYPLCETDYFRRLDLLCVSCGGALRGSYISAMDRKYHIEHFTCSVCPTVFGAQDSYYEHESNVYCHYHYSTQFAQKCNGCHTAILKQFVEIFRNGQDQHWHPECYMIHKYWNVRLHAPNIKGPESAPTDRPPPHGQHAAENGDASDALRKQVRDEEEAVEYKVHWIWQTLSSFEERSATCISDMLLHVSNGAYMDGVVAAKKFITHVDLLFTAADDLDRRLQSRENIVSTDKDSRPSDAMAQSGLSYSREAKLLCKKVVAFFQLLTEKQDTGVRRLGVTQELLSLVTGLAHYLKLMIRICLSGALRLERETANAAGLEIFLHDIGSLDERLEAESQRDSKADEDSLVRKSADTCACCKQAVEDRCLRVGHILYHINCVACTKCGKSSGGNISDIFWSDSLQQEFCEAHAPHDSRTNAFVLVSRLQQYTHLLRVAHARLLATLRSGSSLPHTSDDPNIGSYDSQGRGDRDGQNLSLRSDSRSKSYSGHPTNPDEPTYEDTMIDIKRLRSTRMDRQLSTAGRHARTSRIIGGPQGVRPGSPNLADSTSNGQRRTGAFQVVEDRDADRESRSQLSFGNQNAMTLDDISRIVQAQQTREQRPNASKYARQSMIPPEPQTKNVNGHARVPSGAMEQLKERPAGTKKYFSELTALEYFIVRHVAVLSLEPLLEGHFNQEELLDLIETKRNNTFWSKFGKAFQAKEKKPKGGKTAIFGVPLEQLLERDYEESTDGVGPGSLKVPSLVQEALSAMRTMDMSVEGVFRKNGNIKRLNDMKEEIDSKGSVEVDLNRENPVQVAALLKKFLRELPDPLLTFKLHKLWITSQKLDDADKRRRVLHLTCCLLPKSHRDVMEVLFAFMTWVSSFSHVDEESGSKMDIHNLATVITPNILHRNIDTGKEPRGTGGLDESFLAIEAVHSLIQCNEAMCEVPEDLALIVNDSSLFSNSAEITTKEILRRYGDRAKAPSANTTHPPQSGNGQVPSSSNGAGPSSSNPLATRVDRDPHMQNAWSNESSVRHVGSDIGGTTPPTLPYAQPRYSSDSHGSPNRGSVRALANDKQQTSSRALGIA